MMNLRISIPLFAFCIAFAGCAQYASISERRPQFRPVRSMTAALVSVEQRIATALRKERGEPLVALGEYLAAAQAAAQEFERNPGDKAAQADYNFAVARVIGIMKEAQINPWTRPLRVPAEGGDFLLTFKPDPRPQWNPLLFTFVPADQFDVRGKYVTEKTLKDGLGAPLVAIGRETNKNMKENFGPPRTFYGVTAVIRFEGRRAILSIEDPLATEHVRFGGKRFPLAANYTVPLAVMLASANPKQYELPRLLRPELFEETARITRLQPYDPNKTVVLVIHGLMDTPATWTPMINALRGDERIRQSCQFWLYSYPSGYPYPYAAMLLRRELDAIEKKFPLKKPMVVIGHSMGGCIARLLITDPGDKLWMEIFKKTPQETQLAPETKKLLSEAVIFPRRPEVGRVVFISAPLRGSNMAKSSLGRIGSMLVKTPTSLLRASGDLVKTATFQSDELKLKRMPNSVDTLAPNNRFVKAINTVPVTPGIPYHVISGDRGVGGNKDRTKPVCSDGIVPYWSSHMPGAQSELVVPSDHGAHQNAQAIKEVRRILRLHAAQ
ncbi:MAG: alpha/beta fold hydrolase [Verrucomicrobiae bacterium]